MGSKNISKDFVIPSVAKSRNDLIDFVSTAAATIVVGGLYWQSRSCVKAESETYSSS